MNNEKEEKSLAYKIGSMFGVIIAVCAMSIVVALAVKIIAFIFAL